MMGAKLVENFCLALTVLEYRQIIGSTVGRPPMSQDCRAINRNSKLGLFCAIYLALRHQSESAGNNCHVCQTNPEDSHRRCAELP